MPEVCTVTVADRGSCAEVHYEPLLTEVRVGVIAAETRDGLLPRPVIEKLIPEKAL
jgi:hypothetical protein